ncbi:carbohydrate ABC transporter substrate-binding protein (CUT1 family) [Kribbella amoyensis]|uniref:Carbohydrate ABC transporter substrate-binding protein (CUT1 family) n=1 Tax=Kribbella amoyensis TaxID=996641 RepID=A0A561BR32_9ACTN|nr:extracellular solute-binding protein [Kribbella amoyensis]TWD81336.1 carbohydrate ABC transporter substrate-binding protein (CUT1 family) [Kribbella amoyensis]
MTASHPTRRTVLTAALGLAGVATLGGCGSLRRDARIREWNLFGGGDGARLLQIHDKFVAEHKDMAFEAHTLAWGPPFYTKLAMSAAGGRAPEVATLHLSRLKGFSPATMLDPIPLDLLAKAGITEPDFLPATWDRCKIDGQLYAVPLDQHPFVLYYNTDICAKAGLLGPDGRIKPVRGVEPFLDMLRAVKEVTGKFAASIETTNPWRMWWTLYGQLEGGFFDESGRDLVIDDAKALEALGLMAKLAADGLTPKSADYPSLVAQFSNGDAGLSFNGEWEVTTYQTAKLPFSMAPFPVVYDVPKYAGDAHTFVLPHQAVRNEADTAATIEYIAWMLKNSAEWAAGGHIPAYQPVVASPEYLNLKPQAEYRSVAPDVLFDPDAWFSGSGAQLQNEAGAAFAGVLAGRTTPRQGLDQFKAATRKLLDTPSPV